MTAALAPVAAMSACRHEESLYGRCTACGLTWDGQAAAHAVASATAALTAALAELVEVGDQAADIATVLDARRITGDQGRPDCCPVAVFLRAAVPMVRGLWVYPLVVSAVVGTPVGPRLVEVDLPVGVSAFVAAFDQGRFCGLVTPREAVDR